MTRKVSPAEAKALQAEGYTYVDVRSVPEFEQGHPAGAVNIPLMHRGPAGMSPNPEFVAVFSANFSKDAKLVIGCLAGGRSARAVEALTQAGFTGLVDQRAGFGGVRDGAGRVLEAGWADAGLPVEAGASDYPTLAEKAGRG
jgi:rhodanese-related sulfurtransferase